MAEAEKDLPRDGGWEYEPTPERANLKELADLISQILHDARSTGTDPRPLFVGYADEIIKRHMPQLPPRALSEIMQAKNQLEHDIVQNPQTREGQS